MTRVRSKAELRRNVEERKHIICIFRSGMATHKLGMLGMGTWGGQTFRREGAWGWEDGSHCFGLRWKRLFSSRVRTRNPLFVVDFVDENHDFQLHRNTQITLPRQKRSRRKHWNWFSWQSHKESWKNCHQSTLILLDGSTTSEGDCLDHLDLVRVQDPILIRTFCSDWVIMS